jgi:hypothetical protein
MKINREELYKLYMSEIERISDECDWVTHFTPKHIIGIVSEVIEKNPKLIENEENADAY